MAVLEKKLWQREYRANNYSRFVRYWEKARLKKLEGRRCKLCEIALDTPFYGAKATSSYCVSCSKDKKNINKLKAQRWRDKEENQLVQRMYAQLNRLYNKEITFNNSQDI